MRRAFSPVFAIVALLFAPLPAAAQSESSRGITNGPSGNADQGLPIGLRASLDRPEPVYALGERLGLTITAAREASIEIWELDAGGKLNKILPARGETLLVGPGRPLKLPMPGQNFAVGPPLGVTELHIIARTGILDRSVDAADARLAGRAQRQDLKLRYTIVGR